MGHPLGRVFLQQLAGWLAFKGKIMPHRPCLLIVYYGSPKVGQKLVRALDRLGLTERPELESIT